MDGLEFVGDKIRVSHGNGIFPFGFFPTLHLNRMSRPARIKEPQNVFVCSMADLFGDWVPDEWIEMVLDHCYMAPQHSYLFLTKNPDRYYGVIEYMETGVKNCTIPPAIYLGATAANKKQLVNAYESRATWLSIEPLLEDISGYFEEYSVVIHPFDGSESPRWIWVVLGAETGNRKDKIIPKREWVEEIIVTCRFWKIPVFMKNSMADIWGEPLIQEFPWESPENAGAEA
jgi:protein gp37